MDKTHKRVAAVNSFRSVAENVETVTATHLIPETPSLSHTLQNNFGTNGSKLLAKIMRKAYGGVSVYPVHPCMIFSTDDTTIYTVVGGNKERINDDFVLVMVHGNQIHKASTQLEKKRQTLGSG